MIRAERIKIFCDALIAEGQRPGNTQLAWAPFLRRVDVMEALKARGYWLGSDWDPYTRHIRYYAFQRLAGSV